MNLIKEGERMVQCPNCHSRSIGKVGNEQFYCWNCYKEFNMLNGEMEIYDIAEDGSLISFNQEEVDATIV